MSIISCDCIVYEEESSVSIRSSTGSRNVYLETLFWVRAGFAGARSSASSFPSLTPLPLQAMNLVLLPRMALVLLATVPDCLAPCAKEKPGDRDPTMIALPRPCRCSTGGSRRAADIFVRDFPMLLLARSAAIPLRLARSTKH